MNQKSYKKINVDRIQCEPKGLVAIHIKNAYRLELNLPESTQIKWNYLIVRLSYRGIKRESRISRINKSLNECIFDDLKHLPIRFSKNVQTSEEYDILFELLVIGIDLKSRVKFYKILSESKLNIFGILCSIVSVRKVEMYSKFEPDHLVCIINLDYCFAYGQFGYGYSNQYAFLNKGKDTLFKSFHDYLTHTIFKRVDPPFYRKIPNFSLNILEPLTVKQIEFLSTSFESDLDLKYVYDCSVERQCPILKSILGLENKTCSRIDQNLARLKLNRKEKLTYLRNLLNEDENKFHFDLLLKHDCLNA